MSDRAISIYSAYSASHVTGSDVKQTRRRQMINIHRHSYMYRLRSFAGLAAKRSVEQQLVDTSPHAPPV